MTARSMRQQLQPGTSRPLPAASLVAIHRGFLVCPLAMSEYRPPSEKCDLRLRTNVAARLLDRQPYTAVRPRAASKLQAPGPATAKYRNTKQ